MTRSLITLMPWPESDAIVADRALTLARSLAAALGDCTLLPATRHLRELVRDQLTAVTTDTLVLFDPRNPPDRIAVQAHLARLAPAGPWHSGPAFRTATLRAALRAPLVGSETIYDEVAFAWLQLNLAAHAVATASPEATRLPAVPTPRHALAALALAHHLLCRCPLLPASEALRGAAAEYALGAWRRHRGALPLAATTALKTILAQAPPRPPTEILRTKAMMLAAQLSPPAGAADLGTFCTEIETHLPGLFGGRALGVPALQPAPP